MNIDELNKRHFINQDMYYRVGHGLSSKLMRYENGIIYLELEIRSKWTKSLNAAVSLIANSWHRENPEFSDAIACKINIIDSRRYRYKRTLMHLGIKPGYDACKGVFFK